MLTSRIPTDWRDLQESVAAILRECGFSVEVEKLMETVRGNVEIDVFAEEQIHGRRYVALCECKHWIARVPQTVIHGFRTVVADTGANVGYIVSLAGFQSGALTAAELTNIRLVTWEQFQEAFEATWIEHHLLQTVTERLDSLFSCTEPLLPGRFLHLEGERRERFYGLRRKHEAFGVMIFTCFTSYTRAFGHKAPLPPLPLRTFLKDGVENFPDDVLDAVGYRDLMEAVLRHGEAATAEFNALLEPLAGSAP